MRKWTSNRRGQALLFLCRDKDKEREGRGGGVEGMTGTDSRDLKRDLGRCEVGEKG